MELDNVRRYVEAYIDQPSNPDLMAYGQDFLTNFERGVWEIQEKLRLGRMRRSRVLDIGCGFGWQAMLISLLGQNEVIANDIREEMTSVVRERIPKMQEMGCDVTVTPVKGDVCELDLPPESVDGVFSHQCIEHVHDLAAMFRKVHDLLKVGGRCVISNTSNALHRETRESTEQMWNRRDNDWEYINELKAERPIENATIEPYAVMRHKIASVANAALLEEDLHRIVDATAGLTQDEIQSIAQDFHPGYELPERPPLSWCRNPITKEYCERLLDPFEVARVLESSGLRRVRIRHLFRRVPLRLLNGIRFRPCTEYLFNIRGAFVIVGVKA